MIFNYNYSHYKYFHISILVNKTSSYVLKRFMLKHALHKSAHYSLIPSMSVRGQTTTVVRMKKNSSASNNLAADDKGIHPHVVGQVCTEQDCEKKECLQLCSSFKKLYTKGFFTHKPIAGKFCRFVSDIDSNNKEDTQYFVKNTDKTKEVAWQKATTYYQNKEINNDNKMNNFMQNSDIINKIHD